MPQFPLKLGSSWDSVRPSASLSGFSVISDLLCSSWLLTAFKIPSRWQDAEAEVPF